MTHRHSSINELMGVLLEYKTKPFKWGESDCCMFVCDCVKAQTGKDPAELHRGHYTTEKGAKQALEKYGGIEDVFDGLFERTTLAFAHRGDAVLYESELGKTMGIVWNGGIYGMGLNGLVMVDAEPHIIWSVK